MGWGARDHSLCTEQEQLRHSKELSGLWGQPGCKGWSAVRLKVDNPCPKVLHLRGGYLYLCHVSISWGNTYVATLWHAFSTTVGPCGLSMLKSIFGCTQ